jgi:hypothetical protein
METAVVDLNESRQTEVLVVGWVMTGTAISTVAIKLFARAQIVKVIGWDDVFIMFSLVSRRVVAVTMSRSRTDLVI